jgi:hypothetical protein
MSGKQVLVVDPGVHGGLALVDSAARQIIDSIELPVVGVRAKERIDVLAIRSWVEMHRPDHAVIERAHAMPKQRDLSLKSELQKLERVRKQNLTSGGI